ncbi:6106_t:CDS:2, partial [Racocetra fulgida]
DITDGIPKHATLQFCRNCERYLQPPNIWIRAELESRELLSLCLKKLKGLNKVKLIDAGFIWTEPHSRRIKVKLTVQKEPFNSLATTKNLVEYYVLDVEPLGPTRGKYILADIQVARSADFGKNDITFFARSHLGGILSPGDNAMGYDLSSSNFNDITFDSLNQDSLPDVVLVKKSYSQRRRKNKRNWKLKSLAKEEEQLDLEKMDQDYEMFLRDLEEDSELRQNINLYKASDAMVIDTIVEENNDDEDDLPEVKLEELLDDLTLNDDVDPNNIH